jgi:hypothetical protein
MMAGPLAELAINRALMRGLEQRVADAQAIADRRAREAYEAGLRHGRRLIPVALLVGAGSGGLIAALVISYLVS